MGMGKRQRSKQENLFIPTASLARTASHAFYEGLNEALRAAGFYDFVEDLCESSYVAGKGRPSILAGTYFRMIQEESSKGGNRSAQSTGGCPTRWPCGPS